LEFRPGAVVDRKKGASEGPVIVVESLTDLSTQEPTDDLEKLQGVWKEEIHDTLGKPASKKFLAQEHQWIFTKDGISTKDKEGVGRKGTFRLDPKKDPKTLDITLEPGLPPGPRAKVPEKEILKCIYSLDGDTLKICYGFSDARPTAFESKAEPATGLIVLRRQPPAKEKPGKD
jgi:uncharacterized protein (TIGR03067 family)